MYKLDFCFNRIYCLTTEKNFYSPRWKELNDMVYGFEGTIIPFIVAHNPDGVVDHIDINQPSTWKGTRQSYNHYLCLRKIVQEAKKDRLKNFLFMEEDVIWTNKFEERFTKAWNYIATHNWDMFYFGANHCGPISTSPPLNEYKLCRTTLALGMHSVAINHTMYDELIDKLDAKNNRGLDECPYSDCTIAHLFHKHKNVYCIFPGVAWQLNKEPERFTDTTI